MICDTSGLLAALIGQQPHHEESLEAINAADQLFISRALVADRSMPGIAISFDSSDRCPGLDHGASVGRVARIEHHQAGVVHPAVGILKGTAKSGAQWLACRIAIKVEHARSRNTHADRDDAGNCMCSAAPHPQR